MKISPAQPHPWAMCEGERVNLHPCSQLNRQFGRLRFHKIVVFGFRQALKFIFSAEKPDCSVAGPEKVVELVHAKEAE